MTKRTTLKTNMKYKDFLVLEERALKLLNSNLRVGSYGELTIDDEDKPLGEKRKDGQRFSKEEIKRMRQSYKVLRMKDNIESDIKRKWSVSSDLKKLKSVSNKRVWQESHEEMTLSHKIEYEHLKTMKVLIESAPCVKEAKKCVNNAIVLLEAQSSKLETIANGISGAEEFGKIHTIENRVRNIKSLLSSLRKKSAIVRPSIQREYQMSLNF